MNRKITIIAAAFILIAGFALATEETRWINVHVTEHSEGTNVEVHLPLNLVLSVLKSVDVENFTVATSTSTSTTSRSTGPRSSPR